VPAAAPKREADRARMFAIACSIVLDVMTFGIDKMEPSLREHCVAPIREQEDGLLVRIRLSS
jgi:hypothetical protein